MAKTKTKQMVKPAYPGQLDHIIEAHFVRPARLHLQFADGFEGTWTFDKLGLDVSTVKVTTFQASRSGDHITVMSKLGEELQLDSSSFRFVIDANYAAHFDKQIASVLVPSERLERIAANHQPPQEWYDSTEEPE